MTRPRFVAAFVLAAIVAGLAWPGWALFGDSMLMTITTTTSSSGGAALSTSWDPATLGPRLSLSVANTKVTNPAGGSVGIAYSTKNSSSAQQKNYFELTCNVTGTNNGFGLQDNNTQIAYLGVDTHSIGLYRTTVIASASNIASWAGCVNGDVVGITNDETVTTPTISVKVLHAGVWGATSGPFSVPSGITQGEPLYIGGNPGDVNDAITICADPSCAASPAGLPSGAVWFGTPSAPPWVVATSISCTSCAFTAGTGGTIGGLSVTMSDGSPFAGTFAKVNSGSVGATACYTDPSGNFSVNSSVPTGTLSVNTLAAAGSYNICWSATQGLSTMTNVVVVTGNAPGATASLTAASNSIASGSSTTLSWTSNQSSCSSPGSLGNTAVPGFSGAASGGPVSTGALTATTTYSIQCGTATAATTVTVTGGVTAQLTASPTNVSSGGSSNLSWTSSGASSCTSPGSLGNTAIPSFPGTASGGPISTGALSTTTTYSIQCGTATSAATVTVGNPTIGLLPSYNDASANWQNAGTATAGGIPAIEGSYTQCGATVTPSGITPPAAGDDASKIKSALSACTAGHFVLLSGLFNITISEVPITVPSGVVLRGSGTCNNPSPFTFPMTAPVNTGYCPTSIAVIDGILPFTGFGGNQACGVDTSHTKACPNGGPPVVFLGFSAGTPFWGAVALAADAAKGATTVQLASTSNFSAGQYVLIDEATGAGWVAVPPSGYDGWANVWASPEYLNSSGSPAVARIAWSKYANAGLTSFGGDLGNQLPSAPGSSGCWFGSGCDRVTNEIHKITAVGTSCPGAGCTLTFDDPLMIGYRQSASHNANVYYPTVSTDGGATFHPADNMAQNSGLENISILRGPNAGVQMRFCRLCWVTGTDVSEWEGGGITVQMSVRDEFNNVLIELCQWCTNNGGEYSFDLSAASTEILFTNSITQYGGKGMVGRGGGAGSVVSYSNLDKTVYWAGFCSSTSNCNVWVEMSANASHYIGPHHVLFEGNFAVDLDNDNTHGSSNYLTYYRNWGQGYRTKFTNPPNGITIDDEHNLPGSNGPFRAAGMMGTDYWISFLGNLLGSPTFTNSGHGWTFSSTCGWCQWSIYLLGWNVGSLGGGPGPGAGTDPYLTGVSGSYYYTHGNYDYFNNSVKWDPGNSNHTLTNSFYLTSQPSFFGTQAGCTYSWPWITPASSPPVQSNSCGGSGLPAKARADAGSPLAPPGPPPPPTISGVALSNGTNFATTAAPGATIDTLTAVCSAGSCAAATFSLPSSAGNGCTSGQIANNSSFAVSGSNLNIGGASLGAGNYAVGIQVTLAGATNTPQCYPQTLTAIAPASYFNPAATVTLSNGTSPQFRTATAQTLTTGNDIQVDDHWVVSGISGQKIYYEMACTTVNGNPGAGYANQYISGQAQWLGKDGNSAGFFANRNYQHDNTYPANSWDGCVTGDTIGIYLDATGSPMQLYASRLHSGTWGPNWNNTARSGSTAPTTGGYAVSANLTAAGTNIPAGNLNTTGDAVTICGNSGCAASPSGIPTGAVWFDTLAH